MFGAQLFNTAFKNPDIDISIYIYTWIFENRVSEDKGSFYYLAIKSSKIRPKADKKAYIWRRAVS